VRRRGPSWGPAEALRYEGDNWGTDDGEAQFAPDGKTLYFTSGRSEPVNRTWTRARMLARLSDMEKWTTRTVMSGRFRSSSTFPGDWL